MGDSVSKRTNQMLVWWPLSLLGKRGCVVGGSLLVAVTGLELIGVLEDASSLQYTWVEVFVAWGLLAVLWRKILWKRRKMKK